MERLKRYKKRPTAEAQEAHSLKNKNPWHKNIQLLYFELIKFDSICAILQVVLDMPKANQDLGLFLGIMILTVVSHLGFNLYIIDNRGDTCTSKFPLAF